MPALGCSHTVLLLLLVRFLDCHMKYKCFKQQQLSDSPPVHFWSVGEERWLSASSFPPAEVTDMDFSLGTAKNVESHGRPFPCPTNQYALIHASQNSSEHQTSIRYQVDYDATTQGLSRWIIAKHPFRMATSSYRQVCPSSRKKSNSLFGAFSSDFAWSSSSDLPTGDLLLFTSAPLGNALRIAGSPLLRLSLNLTGEFERRSEALHREIFDGHSLRVNRENPAFALDVTVFGYLEDVDPAGAVHYVTEGRVLLSHRPTVAHSLSGLTRWDSCVKPPYIENGSSAVQSLRQTSRIGSADIVYQSGDQSQHHFSVGKSYFCKSGLH